VSLLLAPDALDDPLAAIPPELLSALLSAPDLATVELDREIVRQGGLRAFAELAWHAVEADGSFRPGWHIDAICEHLEAVSRGEIRRLGIAVPPRHMKSLLVSCFWPAWDWIEHPERRFLFSSYAQALAIRDAVKARRVIQSPWFQARWGDVFQLTSDQNAKERYENNKHGYRIATSVGGRITGEGGDVVAVDDPHNVSEAESEQVREGTLRWWDESMSTRLNDAKTGAYVIIQQRVHERDLMGHVLKKGGEPYTYLCLPAEYEHDHPHRWIRDPRKEDGDMLWPEHMPREVNEERKTSLGVYAAAAQLQQRPAPREGGLFKRAMFSIITTIPSDCEWIRAWDLAATEEKATKSDPDWTATVKMGFSPSIGKFVIGHAFRVREDPHQVRTRIKSFADADTVRVRQVLPQDPGQAGKDQAKQMARLLAGWSVIIELQTGDKWTRAQGFAAQAAAGNVALVAGEWNDAFLEELASFPNGAHDDWVDAASSAFNKMSQGSTGMLDYMRQQLLAMNDARAGEAALLEKVRREGSVSAVVETTDQSFRAAREALLNQARGGGG
jgi:predicted phage terminase large subunit-like protein